ncbi:sensor histidine kinase [Paenibacillus periandrae]|uniref:sensor histidine kinase n=1 Tax=Paenibacillus periandrae TaxID=1761741 RepID=UPI001F099DA9|nr:ATP-binding protein [Paenibacillus periandrae]
MEEHHFIRLDAWIEDDDLVMVVEDNGVGIAPDRLAVLQSQLDTNQLAESNLSGGKGHGGIGMMNVHRRIQLVFGEKYGLCMESEQGKGTRLFIRFPDLAT